MSKKVVVRVSDIMKTDFVTIDGIATVRKSVV